MIAHVVRAHVREAEALREAVLQWRHGLARAHRPSGCVVGQTSDGEVIAFLRFATDRAALGATEDAPWSSRAGDLVARAVVSVSDDVDTFLAGATAEASFVQVLRGRTVDRELARELMPQADRVLARIRPDIVGGHVAWHSDATFTEVVGFRSAAEARAAEGAPIPEGDQAFIDLSASTHTVDEFLDLTDLWLIE